jgi:hypothetical protein
MRDGSRCARALRGPEPLFVTSLAATPHPVLELALGLVEGVVRRHVGVLVAAVVRRGAIDEELVPGEAEVDGDAVADPVTMMMTCEVEDDVARNDVREEVLELRGAPLGAGREGVGVSHASKREL